MVKRKKEVGAVPTAEIGAVVTLVTCMKAARGYVPPTVIFLKRT